MKNWVWNWSFVELMLYSIILNIFVFILSLAFGKLFQIRFSQNKAYDLGKTPLSRVEIILSTMTVLINTGVLIAGWYLWKYNLIQIREDNYVLPIFLDGLILFLAMDVCMYFFHRVAHIKILFNLIHTTHHEFKNPTPITLFVLNPFESIGFGLLWLILLCLYSSSWYGMILYLNLNTLFGLIGHLGVEPFPSNWLRLPLLSNITTSTFHILHHQNLDYNFGFYTTIWDRLFKTIHPNYKSSFEKIA